MKCIFVEFRGLKDHNNLEFCLAVVPPEMTIGEFASLWGDASEIVVYAPARILPLRETVRLCDYVEDWDAVTVASCWINALSPPSPYAAPFSSGDSAFCQS